MGMCKNQSKTGNEAFYCQDHIGFCNPLQFAIVFTTCPLLLFRQIPQTQIWKESFPQLLKLWISGRKARPYVRCWWLWKQLSTGPLKHVRWQRRCRAWWFDVVLGPKAGSSNFSLPRRNEASMKRQPILWALPKVKSASCSCRGSVWRRRLFRGKL